MSNPQPPQDPAPRAAPVEAARALEPIYPLLHALAGSSAEEFVERAAALDALVADGRPTFGARDHEEVLYWIEEDRRAALLRRFRQHGWLDYDPASGDSITDAGRWVYEILGFLHRRRRERELRPSIAGIRYAIELGLDPTRHLESLRARLGALVYQMELARASHSEVILREATGHLDDAVELSAEIRAVLDHVPLDRAGARRVVREIHELLSLLHGKGAELHEAITEVGRQYLRLHAGMSVEQIVRALRGLSRDELAAVGSSALRPIARRPPLLNTDTLAAAAERQMQRERPEPEPYDWAEPAPAPREPDRVELPEEVAELLADLVRLAEERRTARLSEVIPADSAGTSFLRASLLSLVGDRRAGEGVAGRLGALPLAVRVLGEGPPEPLERSPLAALSPGEVLPTSSDG
jgi:hypothetical protein